jgi:hypothetical protein
MTIAAPYVGAKGMRAVMRDMPGLAHLRPALSDEQRMLGLAKIYGGAEDARAAALGLQMPGVGPHARLGELQEITKNYLEPLNDIFNDILEGSIEGKIKRLKADAANAARAAVLGVGGGILGTMDTKALWEKQVAAQSLQTGIAAEFQRQGIQWLYQMTPEQRDLNELYLMRHRDKLKQNASKRQGTPWDPARTEYGAYPHALEAPSDRAPQDIMTPTQLQSWSTRTINQIDRQMRGPLDSMKVFSATEVDPLQPEFWEEFRGAVKEFTRASRAIQDHAGVR